MSLVLTGYRGSGKTTAGRKLAERLGKSFVDCDDVVVTKAGRSIREIFAEHGEAGFRKLEAEAVREIALLQNHVIALGGGALTGEANLRAILEAGHTIVYLRCEPAELRRRIAADPGTSDNRPNLTGLGGGVGEIESLLVVREPIYRAAMSRELDVTDLTPEEVVAELARMI
jgi:shikimate kinase